MTLFYHNKFLLRKVVDEIRTYWAVPSNYFFIPNLTEVGVEIN